MVTYYRSSTLLITHEVFRIRWPNVQQFDVADLRQVHVVPGSATPLAARSIGASGALLIAASASWPILQSPMAWLMATALVAAPSVVGGACYYHNRPVWELRATYHGDQVELYATSDTQTFGQVKRALLRALEANAD